MKENTKREKIAVKKETFDPGNVMIVVYLTFVLFMVLLGGLGNARASETERTVNLADVSRGELLFTSEDGTFVLAPDLSRQVDIQVSGITARVTVKQKFVNESPVIQEAIYAFPLPDDCAVDRLELVIGERRIKGIIKEKQAARATYEAAKREGKKASLLVQKRPNLFTTRVASIGPGETVMVEIGYQQQVIFKDNSFSLRFPLAYTPRYTPPYEQTGGIEGEVFLTDNGWAIDKSLEQQTSPLTINVQLDAGITLGSVDSLYHSIQKKRQDKNSCTISYTSNEPSYQDFVLKWQLAGGGIINAAIFNEKIDGETYSLVMLVPPVERSKTKIARELIFIIDISGSMAGTSIAQAKESLIYGLEMLNPEDSFNIITFNNSSAALFSSPVQATESNLFRAKSFVRHLQADGGTEMKPALQLALASDSLADETKRIQQVVFMTDGAVSNEEELFSLINKRIGSRRLFTVGIGSAPNTYFMSRAAVMGRGTFTYVGNISEVQKKIELLFNKIESPVMSDISLAGADDIEVYPARIPDLYAGEPLLIAIKNRKDGRLAVTGSSNGQTWTTNFQLQTGAAHAGIGSLWARKKIRALMDEMVMSRTDSEEASSLKKQIIETALKYKLVSKYTSLVAVEEKSAQQDNAMETLKKSKTLLAQNAASIYAGGSQTATPAELLRNLGGLAIFLGLVLLYLLRRSNRWER